MAIKLSKKEISLDLQHQGFTNTIYVQEGDVDSRELTISIFDDGEEYNISSSSKVYLSGERSDKAVVYREADSFTNNIIKVVFRNEEICAKGISKYKIIIKDADDILSSVYFKVKVYENVYDENGILATPQYSELQEAIKKADSLMDDFHNKLDEHYFVLTEDKDIAGGVPSLDSNTKVPITELYEATTTTKGITQLTDSVTSTSTTTAATPNSVKTVNDSLNSEISRAKSAEFTLTTNLNNEITRATDAESTLTTNLNTEITRAKSAEALKAPLVSPTLTGTPTAPTATAGTNTTQIATTAFVQTAVTTYGGHYVGTSSPSNTNLLWIDTSNSGILKYYDGTTWVEIAGSAEILDSMQSYLTRAQALYDSMYLDCDGETPHLRVVTLIKIKGGTPQQRLIDGGISFDGGTPTSRLLGA